MSELAAGLIHRFQRCPSTVCSNGGRRRSLLRPTRFFLCHLCRQRNPRLLVHCCRWRHTGLHEPRQSNLAAGTPDSTDGGGMSSTTKVCTWTSTSCVSFGTCHDGGGDVSFGNGLNRFRGRVFPGFPVTFFSLFWPARVDTLGWPFPLHYQFRERLNSRATSE